METKYIMRFLMLLILSVSLLPTNYARNNPQPKSKESAVKYKVTFIELGSVRCIPCQKMQVVMKSIEQKYGKQVKVVFHDVWTAEGKPFGEQYKIQVIPVQIFLDDKGNEFYRHEGFFPEEELIKVLNSKGIQ